ncbi:hypothetical protein B0H16DRAFT_1605567 [Mycena metata]|uniref:F-box domain-containing protein n=1 Tax=Mycena metata TaxID=1033252 RepID=A0AAD7HH02_9AGAR|nr:hypothetical protein B0H16DRAFT_1605567 [Mycena metata]
MSVRAAILLEQRTRTEGKSRTEIQQLIEDSHSEIRSVESQIADLELRLASLVERRDRERLVTHVLRYIISPIHLPVELLLEIFAFAICEKLQYGCSKHFQNAYRVSHVCSHWRQLSFSTPRLWTGPINVDVEATCKAGDADGFRSWLARSAPMSVPIILTGKLQRAETISSHPVLEEILAITPRWRSLWLSQPAPAWFFARLGERSLESLEEANLGPEDDGTIAFASLDAAPLLRKLHVVPHPRLRAPWAQITHVTLMGGRGPDICLDIIAQCANLAMVSVDTCSWNLLPPFRKRIPLPHLRNLELEFYNLWNETHFMPFLDSLTAPALTSLVLYFGSPCRWLESAFTAFQLRSPHLTSLELSFASLTSDDLKVALFHAPLLSELELHYCTHCVDDDLILALHYKRDSEPLVPLLRNLSLRGISPTTLSENTLVGMITSRWQTDAKEESQAAPMTIPRWTRVQLGLQPTSSKFSQKFENIIGNLKRTGLPISYSGGITK